MIIINEESIKKNILSYVITFYAALTLIFIVIIYDIKQSYKNEQINNYKINLINENKTLLVHQIDYLKDIIKLYEKSSFNKLEFDLKNSLDNIFVILENIYNKNRNTMSENKLRELILDTLKDLKNSKENGYYFAIDINTTKTYVHAREDFVGKTMFEIAGNKAVAIFDSYKNALKESYYNGAFAYANVAKPNTTSMRLHKKITYVKNFKPYNIMIGIGVYFDDYNEFEKDAIKNYILEKEIIKDGKFYTKLNEKTLDDKMNALKAIGIKNGYTFLDKNFLQYKVFNDTRLAYFEKYEDWDSLLICDISIKNMENLLKQNEETFEKSFQEDILKLFILSAFILFIFILVSYIFSNKILLLIKDYKKSIEDKDLLLINTSKMANIGLMMDALIHQWYRPLNMISLKITKIKILNKEGKLTSELIDKSIEKIDEKMEYLNNTTFLFRNFFKNNFQVKELSIKNEIDSFITIFDEIFKLNSINITLNYKKEFVINTNPEFIKQILMSVIFNSVESFEKNQEKSIKIITDEIDGYYFITIKDNGMGISNDLLPNKLFKYNVSSKENNSGIGLYLTNVIVTTKLNGKISAENIEKGAKIEILIPKYEN